MFRLNGQFLQYQEVSGYNVFIWHMFLFNEILLFLFIIHFSRVTLFTVWILLLPLSFFSFISFICLQISQLPSYIIALLLTISVFWHFFYSNEKIWLVCISFSLHYPTSTSHIPLASTETYNIIYPRVRCPIHICTRGILACLAKTQLPK